MTKIREKVSSDSRLYKEATFQDRRVEKGDERKFQHLIADERPYFIESMGDICSKKILTMGCSTGGVTPFARKGARVVGIDISKKSLDKLWQAILHEELSKLASVSLMDCEHLAIKEKTFDIVLFFGVLHHLEVEKTLEECLRILKPGGKVYLAEPLGLHPIVNIYRLLTPKIRTKFEHPLLPKDFKIMAKYFRIEEVRAFCLTSIFSLIGLYLFKNNYSYEKMKLALIQFDNYLFRRIPFLKYWAWSAVIRLRKNIENSENYTDKQTH